METANVPKPQMKQIEDVYMRKFEFLEIIQLNYKIKKMEVTN